MFNKWQLVEKSKPMVCEQFNVVWGTSTIRHVYIDVYRKKKFNGIYKYKNVIK